MEPKDEKTVEKTETDASAPESPKYLTADELNRAASARDKRLMAQVAKLLDDRFKPKAEPEPEEDEPPPAAADGKPADDKVSRQLAKLQRQIDARDKELAAERAARAEQAAKLARDEERKLLTDALAAQGLDGPRVRHAVAVLYSEDRRVKRNDDGKVVFVADDGDEVELVAGVKKWLAGDDGKHFVPPRGAAGAGTERGQPPRSGPRPKSDHEKRAGLAALLSGRAPR